MLAHQDCVPELFSVLEKNSLETYLPEQLDVRLAVQESLRTWRQASRDIDVPNE